MVIETFQDHHFKQLRSELNTAISDVLSKYGLTHQIGKITYDPNEFRTKLTVRTKRTNTLTQVAISAFEGMGIKAEILPTSASIIPGFHNDFVFRGTNYTVISYKERNHKYPVLANRKYGHTGPSFKFPLEALNPIV